MILGNMLKIVNDFNSLFADTSVFKLIGVTNENLNIEVEHVSFFSYEEIDTELHILLLEFTANRIKISEQDKIHNISNKKLHFEFYILNLFLPIELSIQTDNLGTINSKNILSSDDLRLCSQSFIPVLTTIFIFIDYRI